VGYYCVDERTWIRCRSRLALSSEYAFRGIDRNPVLAANANVNRIRAEQRGCDLPVRIDLFHPFRSHRARDNVEGQTIIDIIAGSSLKANN